MKVSEFDELKDGPKFGNSSDCSDKITCERLESDCLKSTTFYSAGWVFKNSEYLYFFMPVGYPNYYYIARQSVSPYKLMIKGLEFRFISDEDVFYFSDSECYKKEKHLKAVKWEIVDNNYNNNTNDKNFTHLFTFHIMPIKAMRESMQNFWASCKNNGTKPGCDKDATLLKCDKMFIRFDKDHFRILVPDVPTIEKGNSTDGNETLDVSTTQSLKIITTEEVDTTSDDVEVTRIPTATESSGMSKIIIVVIICGIVVLCLTSFVCVLICILFRGEKEEEKESEDTKYSQGTNIRSTQSTTNKPTKDSNVDVEMPSHVSGKEQKGEEKSFNDASTVVETQYQDFNDVNSVVATQMETEEASDLKTCIALPDTFSDTKTCIEVKHNNDFSVKSDKTVPDALISKNTVHEDPVGKEDPLIHNTQSDVEITDSVNEGNKEVEE
ncbi:unnamed protein product [Meloidogyne enterolobii]|uniref:Uncharacterized protein n=1 Tax=Meloidogyne enterolobii TaxID=390850 RepID=A0ACB0ZH13_MELEN